MRPRGTSSPAGRGCRPAAEYGPICSCGEAGRTARASPRRRRRGGRRPSSRPSGRSRRPGAAPTRSSRPISLSTSSYCSSVRALEVHLDRNCHRGSSLARGEHLAAIARAMPAASQTRGRRTGVYSHSIVAGGFEVRSSATRFTRRDLVDDPARDRLQQVVGQARPVGGHRVLGRDRADHDRVAVGALVALDADRADRRQHGEALPELAVEAGAAHLLEQDRVGLAEDLEPLARDLADDPDREARARGTGGARPSPPAGRAPRPRAAPRP